MNREILYHQSIQKEIREILQHYESISPELAFLFKTSNIQIKVTVVKHNSRHPGYGSRRN